MAELWGTEIFLRGQEDAARGDGEEFAGSFEQVIAFIRKHRAQIRLADIRLISR